MNRIIKRCDEREILSTYNKETVAYYHNFRRKGTFMNDYLIAPRLRTLLKSKIFGKDVLDLGCGFGKDVEWCLKNGAKSVMGIEINKDFISIARKNLSLSDVEIVNSSIYDAEKVNKKFDVIYSNMVFDQVQDLDLVFRKISSLLKKGGKIIFVAPHPLSTVTGDYSKFFDNYFVGRKVYHVPKSHNNRLPCYTRTFGDYSKLFYENNLCIEEIVEPKPSACSKKIFPAAYDIYTKLPSVVIFSLSKKENG